jgi:hypothetical protein
MDSALEYLFMRRPSIDYISPAICEAAFSSSSGPIIVLNALDHLVTITGIVFGSTGHPHRLSWNRYPGALCYSVYKLVDELDPNGAYQLIAECISDEFIDLESEGTYKITAITPDGETPFGDAITVVFSAAPPLGDVTVQWIEIDVPLDFSEDETVIVGYVGTTAAVYKAGVITTHALADSDFSSFNAVSPDGSWIVGVDTVSGVDNMVSYDLASYRNLGNDGFSGTGLFDVNNHGHALSTSLKIVDTISATVIVNIPAVYPNTMVVDSNHPHNINGSDQVPLIDIPNDKPVRYSSGVVSLITPADWLSRQIITNIINDAGHVVQTYVDTGSQIRTFFFNGFASASIGDFGGSVTAFAMSDTNWVVGRADNGSSFFGAFRWSPTHALEMLPIIPSMTPGSEGYALDVNDDGWIVGVMDGKAFVYHDGVSIELTSLIPFGSGWSSLDVALFINNLNQVVGFGTYLGVSGRVFLMQLI